MIAFMKVKTSEDQAGYRLKMLDNSADLVPECLYRYQNSTFLDTLDLEPVFL